ncbi:XRE family transcriptional regulator [Candidatus Accumulibacter phosphatis]|uniref:XRE family transcriptional regulator n=1 Tax=Candidatus Accumulibacter contiguus TaxID=2954381 RepID=A0ABX1T8K0_9PROT|nr:XRE family transcriptional regulator [Candidatus Accumulibacter contiguus]
MSSIGNRLREERERLGMSQPAMAAVCGVTMRSQRNYEKDERLPDASYLASATKVNVDVLFVLTGQRSPGVPSLTPEESALLDNFRHSPPAARQALKTTSDLFAKHDCPGGIAESA